MRKLIIFLAFLQILDMCVGQAFSYSPDWGKNGKRADQNADYGNLNHRLINFVGSDGTISER